MTSPSDGNPVGSEREPEIYSLQERPAGHSTDSLADQLDAPPPPPMRRAPSPRTPARDDGGTFWVLVGCNALVFATSICIMVLELTASRLIAKHVGSSLYTWTSVIGVVLAGITVGNYVGGYLADRFNPSRTLGWLFFIASLGCFSVLWLDRLPEAVKRPSGLNWPVWVLIVVGTIFLWPATVLGTISPVVASMALRRSTRTGVTVGNVYAWGALGSIVGTFLTGFWLMDHFGTRHVIALTAAALALLGVVVATGQGAFRAALLFGWLQFIAIVGIAATTTSASAGEWGLAAGEILNSNSERLPEAVRLRLLNELNGEADGLEPDDKRVVLAFLAAHPPQIEPAGAVEKLRLRLANGELLAEPMRQSITGWLNGTAKNSEAIAWQTFGSNLGGHLHQIGLALKLRNDSTTDYHDESNYSYINVAETTEDGDQVRYLRLDKLIHSYFNPNNPTALYYDYEKVYAAVTELAVAERGTETVVSLGALPERDVRVISAPDDSMFEGLFPGKRRGTVRPAPGSDNGENSGSDTDGDDGAAIAEVPATTSSIAIPPATDPPATEPAEAGPPHATTRVTGRRTIDLPRGVTFDAEKKQLRARGGLSEKQAQAMLAQCRSHAWWTVVETIYAKTRRADWGGFESISLDEMPEGVEIPEPLLRTIRYDHLLRAVTAYGRLAEADRHILLGLGPEGPFRRAVANLQDQSRRVSTFFIGGGGFVFPRWIEAKFPSGPRIDVAELDPAVKLAVQRRMGLERDGRTAVNTIIGDARNVVDDRLRRNEEFVEEGKPPVLYDFVYGDAFNDFSVPWHLTTLEFSTKIREMLAPNGIYQVNLIDIYPRAMYPEGTVTNATVTFQGVMPISFGEFKSPDWKRSNFSGLSIRRIAPNNYELRTEEAMPDEVLATLHDASEQKGGLNDAIHRLHHDSHVARHYEGTLPAALAPQHRAPKWTSAATPHESFQVREVEVRNEKGAIVPGTHYTVGYRGAMSVERREALLDLDPGNQKFAEAVNGLYRSSNRRTSGRFLGSFVKTVATVFPNVYVFSSDVGEPSDDRDTFVIVCSMTPLAMERLHEHSDFWKGTYFAAQETDPINQKAILRKQFDAVVTLSGGELLTDDFAPVDNMLSPVFSRQR